MNVLLVNTSDNIGGAAVACLRLMNALSLSGVNVRMMVRDKRTDDDRIIALSAPWQKAVERVAMLPFVGFSWRKSWAIDTNWLGTSITRTEAFAWADVIHLHWVNQGLLSLDEISRITKSGKRIVWTMHDAWCATGGCHLTLDCKKYTDGCHDCHLVNHSFPNIITRAWKRKRSIYGNANIHFTTCSAWLRNCAKASKLMADQTVSVVPNSIDTGIFHPRGKAEARQQLNLPQDKKLILFVSQYISNPMKGIDYLIDALNQLLARQGGEDIGIMILGSRGEDIEALLPNVSIYNMGYQTSQELIATIYSAADVFVLPSLSENLPNTIMEAMACGVPCVGFDVGGIPEMIDHNINGYVARYKDATDLAKGIAISLDTRNAAFSKACIEKVEREYSMRSVAERFINIYK